MSARSITRAIALPIFGWAEVLRLCTIDRRVRFAWGRFALDALLVGLAVVLFSGLRRASLSLDPGMVPWWTTVPSALALWVVLTCMLRPAIWWFLRLSDRLPGASLTLLIGVWASTCMLLWVGLVVVVAWASAHIIDLPVARALLGSYPSVPLLATIVSWRGIIAAGLLPLLPWILVGVPFLLMPGAVRRP